MKKVVILPLMFVLCISFFCSQAAQAHTLMPSHALASAHTTRPGLPAGVYCLGDGCDGYNPHSTDGGSNCVSNLHEYYPTAMNDYLGAMEGQLSLWYSGTCNTFWASVYTTTTYMTSFTPITNRTHSIVNVEDQGYYQGTYTWPNYNNHQWYDVGMVGQDSESPPDCFYAKVNWVDRYGRGITTNTGAVCP
jgi:hypothetical protein